VDIHKPKPWHGWREFLKEYAIIVVGVLTALAAEQGVEWLHWRAQVAETEAALQAEVRRNLEDAYLRVADEPCLSERLSAILAQLRQGDGGWRGMVEPRTYAFQPVVPPVYARPSKAWLSAAWENARASGAFAHMGRERTAGYALIYRLTDVIRELQEGEQTISPRLAPLAFDTRLDAQGRNAFISQIGELDQANRRIANVGRQILDAADKQGLRLDARNADEVLASLAFHGACLRRPDVPLAAPGKSP
jgi:hypothetical protein